MHDVHSLSLSHFTDIQLSAFRDAPSDAAGAGCYKPPGFWVSVDGDDDWPSWCASESFGIGQYRYRITLALNANVLLLSSADDVRKFSRKFGTPERYQGLAWERIIDRWDGLIIAPYQWDCRLSDDTFWYYGWDCASGVIWRPTRAVAIAEEIAPENAQPSGKQT